MTEDPRIRPPHPNPRRRPAAHGDAQDGGGTAPYGRGAGRPGANPVPPPTTSSPRIPPTSGATGTGRHAVPGRSPDQPTGRRYASSPNEVTRQVPATGTGRRHRYRDEQSAEPTRYLAPGEPGRHGTGGRRYRQDPAPTPPATPPTPPTPPAGRPQTPPAGRRYATDPGTTRRETPGAPARPTRPGAAPATPGARRRPDPSEAVTEVIPTVPAAGVDPAAPTEMLPRINGKPEPARAAQDDPRAEEPEEPAEPEELEGDTEGGDEDGDKRPRKQSRGGAALRTFGELMLTAGLVVLLFVVYEAYVTNWISAGKQREATAALDERWRNGQEPTLEGGERTTKYAVADGEGFAKLYIPAFGPDFVFTILEGTTDKILESGPGHYKGTAMPGEEGNFAVAGHRVGKGAPFNDLDMLQSCDALVVETATHWHVYRVLPMAEEIDTWFDGKGGEDPKCIGVTPLRGHGPNGDAYAKTVGREIVKPSQNEVIAPVPHRPDVQLMESERLALITLTTCHPRFSAKERLIIHGVLVESVAKADLGPGELPAALQEN